MQLPNAKIGSVGITGAVLTLLAFICESAGWDVPDTVLVAAVTVIVFVVGYMVPLESTGKHAKPVE